MSEPIVRTIVIEEKKGRLSVRFTPNPREFPINTRADAIHSAVYDMLFNDLKEYADSENIELTLETD